MPVSLSNLNARVTGLIGPSGDVPEAWAHTPGSRTGSGDRLRRGRARLRSQAVTPASEDRSLAELRSRLDALRREVDALEDDVRSAAERLRAGLTRIREGAEELASRSARPAAAGGHAPGADVDGARLTALDLVLRKTPRADARALLEKQFPGVDAGLLLDEVAATSPG